MLSRGVVHSTAVRSCSNWQELSTPRTYAVGAGHAAAESLDFKPQETHGSTRVHGQKVPTCQRVRKEGNTSTVDRHTHQTNIKLMGRNAIKIGTPPVTSN